MTVAALAVALLVVLLARGGGARATGAGATSTQVPVTTVAVTATQALAPAGVPTVSVGKPLRQHPVRPGFLGISMEYYVLEDYAGADPVTVNPIFTRLIRQLTPGQRPVLRIGGDSTDWTWVPTPGLKRPPGIRNTANRTMVGTLAKIAKTLDARMILGINLEAQEPKLSQQMADTLVAAVGRDHVEALEIGNEPEEYDVLPWYTTAAGQAVPGRAPGYDLADYEAEYRATAALLPGVPTAGPASDGGAWPGSLHAFAATMPRLGVITLHGYPLARCGLDPGQPGYPTARQLLDRNSTIRLARAMLPYVATAHAHGKALRVDELNSVACFGAPRLSNTYASALWALEILFQMARAGVDGVNIHTLPGAAYRIWNFWQDKGAWRGTVFPEYYGLLAFADAVPPGSRLLATPDSGAYPQVFAVRTPSGQIHVVVVNAGAARRLALRVPAARGDAVATYLRAPKLGATGGVSLAGQSFGAPTATGRLAGRPSGAEIQPVGGKYVVRLPAHAAVTLSVDG